MDQPVQIRHKTFCFTGILSDMKREECEQAVIERGGYVRHSVNNMTDYLVKGIRPGRTKMNAAAKMYVRQITEREFQAALNRAAREPVLTPLQRANMLANLVGPMTVSAPPMTAPVPQPKPTTAPTRRFALGKREQADG